MSDQKFYPEPIWDLHLTKEQILFGQHVRIAPEEILDYKINPFGDDWEHRYTDGAKERLRVIFGRPHNGGDR